ncbi:hypothetical protein AI2937V1_1842 [Klebsiella oxytoca]|nr:hypothetical protein AI2937V1_1842 [Klebsiella oxytoca]CAH6679980.1 hypothetical protein AI2937V1_1842 [Klebsiella oxytoca]
MVRKMNHRIKKILTMIIVFGTQCWLATGTFMTIKRRL